MIWAIRLYLWLRIEELHTVQYLPRLARDMDLPLGYTLFWSFPWAPVLMVYYSLVSNEKKKSSLMLIFNYFFLFILNHTCLLSS